MLNNDIKINDLNYNNINMLNNDIKINCIITIEMLNNELE